MSFSNTIRTQVGSLEEVRQSLQQIRRKFELRTASDIAAAETEHEAADFEDVNDALDALGETLNSIIALLQE